MAEPRTFGRPRPSQRRVQFTLAQPNFPGRPEQPLPTPTGAAPYRLDLAEVLPADLMAEIVAQGRLVVHTVGDTGGVKDPAPQQLVASGLEADFGAALPSSNPAFFYHLGDVVYYNGESREYAPQFYDPYEHYLAPIFAIPGNHDADPLGDPAHPAEPSLSAFVRNFCAPTPGVTVDAGESARSAMTQPNVYFTLQTPLATFVGLYTNVPEFGRVGPEQRAWFEQELRDAPRDRPLVVGMHHPVYSADDHHSGSGVMLEVLEGAVAASGRWPDLVLAAHVHDYQRFTRRVAGREVPFLVVGGGGYWHLHTVAQVNGQRLSTPYILPGSDVTLEKYVDDRHGFLRLEFTPQRITGLFYTVPRPQEPWSGHAKLADRFDLDWKKAALVPQGTG
ncbi:metallophosphoesterase family protein [Deinococcus sp.]|uniref:metallophosphoesterase family protein n=1 Tax=Deinococcus sp. TaxID=47478 RepID=UPI003C7A3ACF